MPVFTSGSANRPVFVAFKTLGPWPAKFVRYAEANSKKYFNDDGTAKINAFLDFEITDPKVIARYPDTPVIKTFICSAILGKSKDGKPYKLSEALKAISGLEPTEPYIYWELHQKELPKGGGLIGDELLQWIKSLYGKPCRVLLNEIRGEGDEQQQSVDKVLSAEVESGDGL